MNRLSSSFLLRLAWGLCLLTGVALSFKAFREPDLWWMYRTGEWMLENKQVTYKDPFSYTFAGTDWINVKWLFEVIIASGKRLLGINFVFILQGLVTTSLLLITYKSASLVRQAISPKEKKPRIFAGWIITALLLLATMDYRLIGRPEMTSHILTATYLFLFWRHYYKPSKAIFWLIPLQLLWANTHEAFGIGMVLMLGYLGASWVHFAYAKNKTWKRPLPKQLTAAILGALFIIVFNPRGPQLWAHPFNIFGQLSDNQFTTELASITNTLYWNWQAYANFVFLIGSLALVFFLPFIKRGQKTLPPSAAVNASNKKKTTTPEKAAAPPSLSWWPTNVQTFGLGNGLLFFLLFYLSTTAYRNIPFFVLAAAPLFAVGLQILMERFGGHRWAAPLVAFLALAFYGSIATGYYYKKVNTKDTYGLQILTGHNPIGAANFIEQQGISGTCFSDYLTSAYLLWRLQPNFKTYIDLRDLDIFPPDFFQKFAEIVTYPDAFDKEDQTRNFDYVVLFRPQFDDLHKYLTQSPHYHLVFADPVACVYVKELPKHQALIQQYGFDASERTDLFSNLAVVPSSGWSYWLSKLVNPLYVPNDYSNTNQDAVAGAFYLKVQQTDLAFQRAQVASQHPTQPYLGHELQGNLYCQSAFSPSTTDSMRQIYIQQANIQFDQALVLNPSSSNALIGKSALLLKQNKLNNALVCLHQVLDIDPQNYTALDYLGLTYRALAMANRTNLDYVQRWIDARKEQDRLQPKNHFTILDLGIAHCLLSDCQQSLFYLNQVMNKPNLPVNEFALAQRCVKTCGQQ